MSYSCPTCGVEFDDVNAFLSHQRAAILRARERERAARIREEYAGIVRAYPEWGGPGGDAVWPPPHGAEAFLKRYGG